MPAQTEPVKNPLDLDTLILKHGSHDNPEEGMCIMEAVAFVARLPHSDHPECACPVISGILLRLAAVAAKKIRADQQVSAEGLVTRLLEAK